MFFGITHCNIAPRFCKVITALLAIVHSLWTLTVSLYFPTIYYTIELIYYHAIHVIGVTKVSRTAPMCVTTFH